MPLGLNIERKVAYKTQEDTQDEPVSNATVPTAEDYLKASQQQQSSDSYDYLKNMSARDLLSANVQTQIAREVAQANLQKSLAQGGLQNSGYGATASAMIENTAQQGMNANHAAYLKAIQEINQKKTDEQNTILAGQADSIVQNIEALQGNPERLKAFMESKGFSFDDSGKLVYNGNNQFSDYMLESIQDAYNMATGNYSQAIGSSGVGYTSPEDLLANLKITGGVAANASQWGVTNEVYELFERYANNPPKDGFVVRLTNGNSDNHAYVMYRNGKWEQVNEEAYNSASNSMREEIKRAGYTKTQNDKENGSIDNPKEGREYFVDKKRYKYSNGQWLVFDYSDGKWKPTKKPGK